MEGFGSWQVVNNGEQDGLPPDKATQAMVPFAREAQAPFPWPLEIRVGKKKAGFVYKRQDHTGVYMCDRGSDTHRLPWANAVLYLVYEAVEECWYAIDAPRDLAGGAPAIVDLGYPAYRTYNHAVGGGICNWEQNLNVPGQAPHWEPWIPFTTEVLQW